MSESVHEMEIDTINGELKMTTTKKNGKNNLKYNKKSRENENKQTLHIRTRIALEHER